MDSGAVPDISAKKYGDEIGSTWGNKSIFLLRGYSTVIELKKINAEKNTVFESIANTANSALKNVANRVNAFANRASGSIRSSALMFARA